MKMLRIFIGDWRRPTRGLDLVAALLLAIAGLLKLVLSGGGWWTFTLITIGLVAAAVLAHDLLRVGRKS